MELSFCIPVFNFGEFLPETLRSVLEQLPEDAEVIVLDGGSTDGTEAFMTCAAVSDTRVRYVRHSAPGGIDNDLAASVDCARGRYCWLLSGDDTLRPDAVRRVLERLVDSPDLILLAHTNCSSTMAYMNDHPVVDVDHDWRVDLGADGDRRRWLAKARTTEALFSFMSTLVIRRELWRAQPPQADFNGSCWAHIARLLEAARRRLDVVFIAEPLVNRRGENDSFRDRGIVRRLAISVDGFDRIASRFARDQAERGEIMRLVRSDLPIRFFMGAKGACRRQPVRESRRELDRIATVAYGSSGFADAVRLWIYRLFPAALAPPAKATLDIVRRWRAR